ncbi:hypothetical protein J3F84DRAFT_324983 [Trichoderma pleuroticola]
MYLLQQDAELQVPTYPPNSLVELGSLSSTPSLDFHRFSHCSLFALQSLFSRLVTFTSFFPPLAFSTLSRKPFFVFSHSFSSFLSPLFPFRFPLQFRDFRLWIHAYPPLSCLDRAAHNNFCWQPVISLSLLTRRLCPFTTSTTTSISSIRRSPIGLGSEFHRQPSPISSFASHLRRALLFTTTTSHTLAPATRHSPHHTRRAPSPAHAHL